MTESEVLRGVAEPYHLAKDVALVIRQTIQRFYGEDAIVRSYGPNARDVKLHVETSRIVHGIEYIDCMGILFCQVDCDRLSLTSTRRLLTPSGLKSPGKPKLPYREGVII